MQVTQYRHEYKFRITYAEYIVLKSRLSAVMRPDAHAGPEGKYFIRSLYFDDMNDRALREKQDGLSRREKYRIRYYNNDTSFIRLEKKLKAGGLGAKLSAPLTREETERIIAGDIGWMERDERELLRELYTRMHYGTLRPRTVVDYMREPFVYGPGNVRVTLDSDIRSGSFSTDLFAADLPTVPANAGTIILEVKYDNFLPDVIRDMVQTEFRQDEAFSKYAACRDCARL